MIGSNNGSSALLECIIESFPPALTYWIKGDNKLIENNNEWKYQMSAVDSGFYTTHSRLNITLIEPSDYGMYKCAAKNERGKTYGLLTVYGQSRIA